MGYWLFQPRLPLAPLRHCVPYLHALMQLLLPEKLHAKAQGRKEGAAL